MRITDVLREMGVRYWNHGESGLVTAGWIGLLCPWCGRGTNKPGLGIHLATNRVSCWKCSSHSLAATLVELGGLNFRRARELIGKLDRVPAQIRPHGKYQPPPGVGSLGPAHKRYLRSRGFDPDELAAVWGLGGIGVAGRLPWRIFIPVPDPAGNPVSWTTRAIGDRVGMRYVAAKPAEEAGRLKSYLYGQHLAKRGVVVVEGPADCWAIGPGAVATCGVGFTRAQVCRLLMFPVVAVCFDSDPAAQRRARDLADLITPFGGRVEIVRLSGKDAAESPADEIAELRQKYLS